jgi:hypothetical protein
MKINFKKVRENQTGFWLTLDIIMLILIVANLLWMVFDFSFTAQFFKNFIQDTLPAFHDFYEQKVHPDFLLYDLAFVLIFLAEFLLRWMVAIVKKTFDHWLTFVVVYWYDIVGCIPFGSFRFLRLFRIVSLIIRLQKKGVVDVTDTWWYRIIDKNIKKFVDFLTDRVSLNVLTQIQKEVKYGDDTVQRIVNEVVVPKRELLEVWVAARIQFAVKEIYINHKDELRVYLEQSITEAVKGNADMQRLELVPLFGKQISKAVSSSVADITSNIVDKVMQDLSDVQSHELVTKSFDVLKNTVNFSTDNKEIERIVTEVMVDSIEILKQQVKNR